jgi:hypothetical protein
MCRSWNIALVAFVALGILFLLVTPDGVAPAGAVGLVATLTGVVIGISLESRVARRREKQLATDALSLVTEELITNFDVALKARDEEKDLEAVVPALIDLREEFWIAVSRGGRLIAVEDLDLLSTVAAAYDRIRALRAIASLFFTRDPAVRMATAPGFTAQFDPLRKTLAKNAVEAIESALLTLWGRQLGS